jgi:Skp family chaperone for outer membrane proteins
VVLLWPWPLSLPRADCGPRAREKKPAPRTRIAFFNLTYVVKNYDKYKEFQEEIKKYIEPYQKRDAELREQLKELRSRARRSSLVPAKGEDRDEKEKKEELEEKAKKIQRKIEENSEKIKKKLAQKNDNEIKNIYLSVTSAAQEYAKSHDLDLVLHYNDATTEQDFLSVPNIARKMNATAFIPVYFKPSMDISQDLASILNKKAREK